jgi:hypothetical protein
MIEANPRFWGPSQLFVDSGMNLFEAFLHDYGFIPDAPAFHKSGATKYFWFGGVLSELRNGRKPFFHQRCENELLLNLGTWIQHDIYNRPDTVNVFRDEIEWTQ